MGQKRSCAGREGLTCRLARIILLLGWMDPRRLHWLHIYKTYDTRCLDNGQFNLAHTGLLRTRWELIKVVSMRFRGLICVLKSKFQEE